MNIVVASRARVERGLLPMRPFALVSITDPGSSPAAVPPTPMLRDILRLAFDDAQPGDQPPMTGQAFALMTEQDARSIWEFVSGVRGVETFVVQCEAGWSRSAAVAAAVAHVLEDDADRFFRDRSPNAYVVRQMLWNLPDRLPQCIGVAKALRVGEPYRGKACFWIGAYPSPPFRIYHPEREPKKRTLLDGVIFS